MRQNRLAGHPGGVLDISLGGEVRPGTTKKILLQPQFVEHRRRLFNQTAVSYFSLQSYCTRNLSTRAARPLVARNEGVSPRRKKRDIFCVCQGVGTSVHRLSFLVSSGRILREKAECKQSSLRQKLIKSIPWLRQKMIKSIPCLRQKSEKHTLAARTSPLSPYKGVPPLPGWPLEQY